MRAAICREYGAPDVVQVDDVPAPALGAGQVRVRVHAAAVNFPDVLIVADRYQVSVAPPFVPGSEFAGVVMETADDVASPPPGTRVFGATLAGAFGEEVVVAAASLNLVPHSVDDRHAAAFGVAHSTAYHVLRSFAALQPGEELIVLGAGGGVGLAAVQLGAVMGANVTAVASSQEKLAVAGQYGATNLVDHRAGSLRDGVRAVLPGGGDVVIDPVGGDLSEPALRSMRWGGRFVTVGYAAGVIPKIPLNLVLLKGVHVLGFQMIDFMTHRPDELARNQRELLELFATGQATPHIGATFALADVAAALQYVADGRAIGKVVLDIA
ncbi:MAG TPA: NADPH:quinone oxidoreductase family protein [Acidimicrobiia bacterium]|jgi:NADPH2:quinone reductase